MIEPLYSRSVDKNIVIGGREISYRAVSEDFALKNGMGETEATMFSFSYIASGGEKNRPVMFAYNGGPGSDSVWLHLGVLGPKRVEVKDPPDEMTSFPYDYKDNEGSLLDICDIVMIDPVGVGFSMQKDADSAKAYYETKRDGMAFARLIENWIAKYERWDSPVYICGESYGTLRNLALAANLSGTVKLRGIINVGTSFNVGQPEMYVEPSVRRFEAYAAAARFHYPEGKPPLNEFLREAGHFAYTDYAKALLWGSMLPEDEFERVLERTRYYTGMSAEYLRKNRLRIDQQEFVFGLCPGYALSYYDGRVKSPAGKSDKWSYEDDPITLSTKAAFSTAMEKYRKLELGIELDRPYLSDTRYIGASWDYASLGDSTLAMLEDIMRRKPDCRVMFVGGIYDLQSTADFVKYYLNQYDIPRDRTRVCMYESGHMTYFGAPFKPLCSDLRGFVAEVN